MTKQLLSLCCGALPKGGTVTNRFGRTTGFCNCCGSHVDFTLGGVMEATPAWLTLEPLRDLGGIEPKVEPAIVTCDYTTLSGRAYWRRLWQDFVAVSSWAFLTLLLVFMASREGCKEGARLGQGHQRGAKGPSEVVGGGTH